VHRWTDLSQVPEGFGPSVVTTGLAGRLEVLEQTGIDAVLVIAFTPEFAAATAEDFVRTLRKRREAFLAYFTTCRANNGIIELHCRVARGHRNYDNYRLRMRPRRRRTHPPDPYQMSEEPPTRRTEQRAGASKTCTE